MAKLLTDMHTHSAFSHDGKNSLAEMLAEALNRGIAFYGVSDHFDHEVTTSERELRSQARNTPPAEYFHAARHLQEDYAGYMNVFVGAEFGYSDDESTWRQYSEICDAYRPDYVINSVHCIDGQDFARYSFPKDERETYTDYLRLVRNSLDAPYPYDVVGHLEYVVRYAPFDRREIRLRDFQEQIDDILQTIIDKNKILELNSATKQLPRDTLPNAEILKRYYELGGRNISFGSDAHLTERIADKRERVTALAASIGFRYMTIPFRGEYIKTEL